MFVSVCVGVKSVHVNFALPYRQYGFTALLIASQNGRVEVVNTLLQHGASVDLQNYVSAEMLYFVIIHHVQLYSTRWQRIVTHAKCAFSNV